ncbi:MAG: hypothetical protein IJ943_07720 [Akkermansia sp.]|nr:hypothetical protein [Akkermansia sp.]
MAIHIQMSEEAEAELRKEALKNKLSAVLACILFIVMGGGILFFTAVFIVGDTPVSFLAYTPPAEDGPPTNAPTPRELTSRSAPSSSSVAPSVIVATSTSAVALASVEIDMSDGLALDTTLDIGLGDSDLGEGLGDGGSGLGSGQGGGSALEGTFYDLKQTGKGRSRKLSKLAKKGADGMLTCDLGAYHETIATFVQKGWNKSVLSRYFESERKLYASNFYMPMANAKYAPIAYELGDIKKPLTQWVCQPNGWVVVYRGKVRAPKTGKFRFIGTGDDYIGVRFNNKLALSAGERLFSNYDFKAKGGEKFAISEAPKRNAFIKDVKANKDHDHKGYEYITGVRGCKKWDDAVGGLMAGSEIDVVEGKVYPIEIIVAEAGGAFGFVLFIQDITDGKKKEKQFDLFRTNFSTPNADEIKKMLEETDCVWQGEVSNIPYNEDSPIWTAVP